MVNNNGVFSTSSHFFNDYYLGEISPLQSEKKSNDQESSIQQVQMNDALSFLFDSDTVPVVSSPLNQTQERKLQRWKIKEQPQVMTINNLAMYNWAKDNKVAVEFLNSKLRFYTHPAHGKYSLEIEYTAKKALSLVCQAKLYTLSHEETNYLTISEVQEKASNKQVYALEFDSDMPTGYGKEFYISLTLFEASQEICHLTSPLFRLFRKPSPDKTSHVRSDVKDKRAPKKRRIEASANSNPSVVPSSFHPSDFAIPAHFAIPAPILNEAQQQSNLPPLHVLSVEQNLPIFDSKEKLIQYLIEERRKQGEEIKSLKQQVVHLTNALQQAREAKPDEGNDNDPSQDFLFNF
jgi:hypothetical protein